MAELYVNPTRMELKKLESRCTTARRGHKLLKDKRDELMRRFLRVVKKNKELREQVERALAEIYGGLTTASVVTDPAMMKEALLLPAEPCEVAVRESDAMGITLPAFRLQTTRADQSLVYGMVFTSGELDTSLAKLAALRADLLRLAELEKQATLLAAEIERTRRRVNALEHILIPRYLETIKRIRMKLDENERGNITRLLKVKDLMLAATRHHDDFFPDEAEEQ